MGCAAALSCAWPTEATAAEEDDGRPWARGTFVPTFGFGVGYHPQVLGLDFALGGRFFVANGLALGLSVNDTVYLYSSELRATFPRIERRLPTNDLRITPNVQWVFFRGRFSPYVLAGVGPAILNHGGGTLGHWVAGPGAYIGLTPRLFLELGVSFSGLFPGRHCREAFTYEGVDEAGPLEYSAAEIVCGFTWKPAIGLVFALGPFRSRRTASRGGPPARGW